MERSLWYNKKRGVTLLELLFAISIIVIIATIIWTKFVSFRHINELNAAAETVISLLLEARAKTLSSLNDSQHGVRLEQYRVVLFEGVSYSTGIQKRIEDFPAAVEISALSFNAGYPPPATDIVFSRLTGNANPNGTITLRLIPDTSTAKTIKIEPTGLSAMQ
jgi:prepilin-type N-terminal cleavage/methylation domain-containing protein